mmetsp:Transcript_10349/g.13993  ORF Transcript_10349/g.13993 Transcript_10349/m.13993 type:complete len:100 (+) Transcript_10349:616-915(+)
MMGLNQGMMGDQFQAENAQKMLAKQLKSVNMFDETQSAIRFELNIQKLDVQKRLKELTQKIEVLEKRVKQGGTVDKAREFDPIRSSLFELKKEQQDCVV